MKLRNSAAVALVLSAALAAPGLALGQPAPAKAKSAAVATVNGVPVPRSRQDLLMRQEEARGMPDTPQNRSLVRDELINREVLEQQAKRAGLASSPEVQSQLDMARQEIVVRAYIHDWFQKNPVSDADVQKEYDRMKADAGTKEYHAHHILVDSEDEALKLIAELKRGASFEDLASKHSKDQGSAERGGDLDWNVPSSFDKSFADAMVKLEKGKYTDKPVHTRFGYHIIRLDDVRAARFPELAQMGARIRQQLAQQRLEGMVKSLRAKAKIE